MLSFLSATFFPPIFMQDEEKTRVAALLNTTLWSLSAALLFLLITGLFSRSLPPQGMWTMGGTLAVLLFLQIPMRRGHVKLAGALMVLCMSAGVTLFLAASGTIRQTGVVYYLVACVMAGLLIGRRAAIAAALINSLFAMALLYGEFHGLLPEASIFAAWIQGFAFFAGAFMTVVLLNLATRSIDTAMMHARESEQRYRRLLEHLPAITYINGIDPSNPTTYVSPQVQKFLGYSSQEFLADPQLWTKLIHAADVQRVLAESRSTNQTGKPFELDYRLVTKDQRVIWVRDESVLVKDEQDRPLYWLGIWSDISDRKQIENQMRRLEELYRHAIQAADAVPYYLDYRKKAYTFMGDGILKMTGYSPEEITPQIWSELELERYPRGSMSHLTYEEADRLTEAGVLRHWECDYRIRTRDGQTRWISDSCVQVRDENDVRIAVIGILQDITDRKQKEQEIQQRLNELAAIQTVSQAAASELEFDALFDVVSQELFKLFDIHEIYFALLDEPQKLVHFPYYRHFDQRIDTESVPLGKGLSSMVILSRQPLLIDHDYEQRSAELGVVRFSTANASISRLSWLGVPIQAADQVIGMICVMNLEKEYAFANAEVRLLTTIAANVGIAIGNARLFTNVQQELAVRIRAEAELKQRADEMLLLYQIGSALTKNQDPYQSLREFVRELRKMMTVDTFYVTLYDAATDMMVFPLYLNLEDDLHPPSRKLSEGPGLTGAVIASGTTLHIPDISLPEIQNTYSIQWTVKMDIHSYIGIPLFVDDRIIGVLSVQALRANAYTRQQILMLETLAVQVAITLEKARLVDQLRSELGERKRAEAEVRTLNLELERRVEERTAELVAANKELEAFSYSVSHDLRAPLRSINSFTKIIKDDFSAKMEPMGRGFLDRVIDAGRKMNQLIDELLDFSRVARKEIGRQPVNVNELVHAVIDLLAAEASRREIEWKVSDLPPLEADPALMRQVFINLIGNAIKYTSKRDPACIEIGYSDGAYFIRDNGAGFDMQYADKLFGVFQRLHRDDEFEGTGIGLAIVQRILQRHGGRIWAEAEPEQGAAFYFTLKGTATSE